MPKKKKKQGFDASRLSARRGVIQAHLWPASIKELSAFLRLETQGALRAGGGWELSVECQAWRGGTQPSLPLKWTEGTVESQSTTHLPDRGSEQGHASWIRCQGRMKIGTNEGNSGGLGERASGHAGHIPNTLLAPVEGQGERSRVHQNF